MRSEQQLPKELFTTKPSTASQLFNLQNDKKDDSIRSNHLTQHFENSNCRYGKKYQQVCIYENCDKHAIVCSNNDCQCRAQHYKFCRFMNPEIIIELIQSKKKSSPKLINTITEKFDEIIDSLSNMREKIIKNIRNVQIQTIEKEFLQFIEMNQFDKLTGIMMSQIEKGLMEFDKTNKEKDFNLTTIIQKKIEEISLQVQKSIEKLYQILQQQMKFVQLKAQEQIRNDSEGWEKQQALSDSSQSEQNKSNQAQDQTFQKIKTKQTPKMQKKQQIIRSNQIFGGNSNNSQSNSSWLVSNNQIQNKTLQSSIILKNQFQKKWLLKLFSQKYRAESFHLIYILDNNGNQSTISNFQGKCLNIPHTLFLIKTKKQRENSQNQIIGGYTPIAWQANKGSSSVNQSFVFNIKDNLFAQQVFQKYEVIKLENNAHRKFNFVTSFSRNQSRNSFSQSNQLSGLFSQKSQPSGWFSQQNQSSEGLFFKQQSLSGGFFGFRSALQCFYKNQTYEIQKLQVYQLRLQSKNLFAMK